MPLELFLTTREKNKIRNAFANNMKMNIKLSKAQISKKIHSGGVLGSWLGKLGKKVVTDPATPFGKINFAK